MKIGLRKRNGELHRLVISRQKKCGLYLSAFASDKVVNRRDNARRDKGNVRMSVEPPPKVRKNRKNTDFWRACRYLAPYRRIVTISIVCAFAVGFITTGGLGAMLPILRVLLNNDTIPHWVDTQIQAHHPDLNHLPWYLSLVRNGASHLPTHPVKAIAVCYAFILALSLLGSVVRFFQEYLSDKAAITPNHHPGPP